MTDRPRGKNMHWAVEDLSRVMQPPVDGGSDVDWEGIRDETGWDFPADYRDFVAVYGLGAISDSIGINTPRFDGYPYGEHLLLHAGRPSEGVTLTWASNEAGDDFLWRCNGAPDQWPVIFRPRTRRGYHEYPMGMAAFLLGLVQSDIQPPLDAALTLPATYESWRGERRRLLDEAGDFEGF
ncbi:hypothetical protein ACGFZA_41635 [Streptomyces sp. NPDC048211]|uniref:hypothetical protein n=1 Tax=Streptomyces sp. NPDC048211 TaxID=3365516 RepID=UPI00371442B8